MFIVCLEESIMMHLGIRFYQVKDAALISDVGGDQRVLITGRHIPAVCLVLTHKVYVTVGKTQGKQNTF